MFTAVAQGNIFAQKTDAEVQKTDAEIRYCKVPVGTDFRDIRYEAKIYTVNNVHIYQICKNMGRTCRYNNFI